MLEELFINPARVEHYREPIIPIPKLESLIDLDENYLREKPAWCNMEGKIQYFKVRNDYRLFAELFFSIFGR